MFWRKHSKMLCMGTEKWQQCGAQASSLRRAHGGRGETEWRRLSHPREDSILAPSRTYWNSVPLTFQPVCIKHDLNIISSPTYGVFSLGSSGLTSWELPRICLQLPGCYSSPPGAVLLSAVQQVPAHLCHTLECVVRWFDRKAFGHSLCLHTKLSNPDHTISHYSFVLGHKGNQSINQLIHLRQNLAMQPRLISNFWSCFTCLRSGTDYGHAPPCSSIKLWF